MRSVFAVLIAAWLVWLLFNADFDSAAGFFDLWSWQLGLFATVWFFLPLALLFFWKWSLSFSAGLHLPWSECLKTQSIAWAGRYLPGKAGFWFAKVSVESSEASAVRRFSHAVLAEQALFVSAGLLIVVALLPWNFGSLTTRTLFPISAFHEYWSFLLGSAGLRVALVALLIVCTISFIALLARLLNSNVEFFDWKRWLLLLTGHCSLHTFLGLSLFPLIVLIAPDSAAVYGWTGVVAVLALANIAGILAFFAPAGLGVREFVIAFCFANQLGIESALQIAAFLRLVTFISDILFSLTAWMSGRILERNRSR